MYTNLNACILPIDLCPFCFARCFAEALQKLTERACSDILTNVDWGMNMSLVDEINNCKQPIVIKEVVRTLRKKLASKSLGVVMLAL
jgi:VHS domain